MPPSSLDAAVTWSHRFNQFLTLRIGYQFLRQASDSTPHFANRINVSGDAGIAGNNQEPVNWGPPALIFSAASQAWRQAVPAGRTVGPMGIRPKCCGGRAADTTSPLAARSARRSADVLGQQDARGSFTFNGSATGSDVADFLLGVPHSAAIAFGNADKLLARRARSTRIVTDDWRINPTVTLNVGLRWEYEAPFTESARSSRQSRRRTRIYRRQRLSSAPRSSPDRSGIQPRLGVALRPIAGSSLVDSRGLRHLSQHGGLSVDRFDARAAAAAVQALSIESTAAQPLDAGEWIQCAGEGIIEHVRRRSGLPRQLRAQLAGVGAARSAGVAYRHRRPIWDQGQPPDAGVRAEYLSRWRGQSVRGVSERLRLPDVERQLAEERGVSCSCAGGCARVDGRRAVHVCRRRPTTPRRSRPPISTAR